LSIPPGTPCILMLYLIEQITLCTLYETTGWLLSKHSSPAQSFEIHSYPKNEGFPETLEFLPVEVIVLLGVLRRLFLNSEVPYFANYTIIHDL